MGDIHDTQLRIESLIDRDRFGQAKTLLPAAFSLAPDDIHNHMLAARVSIGLEDWSGARQHAGSILSVFPDSTDAGLLMFQIERGLEAFPAAERIILDLLRGNPDTAHLYALYAELMLRALHIDKARALSAESLRLDPEDHLARIVSLLVNIIEDRKADASAELEELVGDDPEALHVAWSIVAVLESQHRHGEALQVMRGILRATPGDESVVEALVELRISSHWSTLPLWPLNRYGWVGSGVLWAIAAGSFILTDLLAPEWTGVLVKLYLVYVVYSWVWPPLLRRWLGARGF